MYLHGFVAGVAVGASCFVARLAISVIKKFLRR